MVQITIGRRSKRVKTIETSYIWSLFFPPVGRNRRLPASKKNLQDVIVVIIINNVLGLTSHTIEDEDVGVNVKP